MFSRRTFVKTAGAAAAVGAINAVGISTARAQSSGELNWYIDCDLTGPAAIDGKYIGEGFSEYAKWINAQGGIRGRKVNLALSDNTYKLDVAVANIKKALASGRVDYMYVFATGTVQMISPENNATHKIFMTSGSFASELTDAEKYPYHFMTGANYAGQLRMLVDYIKKTQPASKPAKLAILHSSTAYGRDGIEPTVAYAKANGIDVVLVQQTKHVETDVSSFALAIRRAQPTHVISHGYSNAVWPEVLRLVRDYGMKDVVFLGTLWHGEREKIIALGDGVAEGLVNVKLWNDDTNKPAGKGMETIGRILRAKNPNWNGYVRLGFLNAWTSSMMATRAFEMVIDSGKPINGDTLSAAMRSLKDWDTGGLIDSPVSVVKQQISVARVMRYVPTKNWAMEHLSDWTKVV